MPYSFIILIILLIFLFYLLLKHIVIEKFNVSTKKSLVFIQYFKDKNSFVCDKTKIWGNWVQSSFIKDLFQDINLDLISCNLDNLPKKADILVIGLEQSQQLNNIINKLKPKIVIFLSDEYGKSPHINNILKTVPLVYKEHNWDNYPIYSNIKLLPLAYHCWDDNYIKYENQTNINNKKYIWCFMGSDKGTRYNIIKSFKLLKPYFNQKTKSGENSKIYNQSKFALCLRGNVSIDCFRQYTSSINGCIPIIICNKSDYLQSYGKYTKLPPFLRANNASEGINLIQKLLNDKNKLNDLQKQQHKWWSFTKNEIKTNIKNTLEKYN